MANLKGVVDRANLAMTYPAQPALVSLTDASELSKEGLGRAASSHPGPFLMPNASAESCPVRYHDDRQ